METSPLDAEELRSPENKDFVDYLGREIDDFLKNNGNSNTIMLFPPFNSYKRLLTHHIVELDYAKCGLSTFSIGEEPRRRTVVCLGSMRRHVLDDDANDKGERRSSCRATKSEDRAAARKTTVRVDVTKPVERARKVRKTISYYVPPHMRKSRTEETNEVCDRSGSDVGGEDAAVKTLDVSVKIGSDGDENTSDVAMNMGSDDAEKSSDVVLKIGTDDVVKTTSVADVITAEGTTWDPLYCGKGSCSVPNLVIPILDVNEMSDITKEVGPVRIVEVVGPSSNETTESDYVNTSMVEIYDLPDDIKTQQLADIFVDYVNRGFRLRWVDTSHALGIFSSSKTAEEFLSSEFARVKIRPISQGTTLSQEVARNVVLPSSFRPKTCSSLARRLLTGALGLKVSASAEERAAQRERPRRKAPT